MDNPLYAYADKRDGNYYAVTNAHIEGPFSTWAEADRRATSMCKAAQQDPSQQWRDGTAGLAWHVERARRHEAWHTLRVRRDFSTLDDADTLNIENPLATCSACWFTAALSGTWNVEDGRLVFRADADPLARRGPDFDGCSESSHDGRGAIGFQCIEVDDEPLTDAQVAELRAGAAAAAEPPVTPELTAGARH